jgi:putative flippase GtrA
LYKNLKYINNFNIREFIRFAIVGLLAAIIHYVVFLLVLFLLDKEWNDIGNVDWQTNLAYSIGYALSLVFNLFLTSKYTFKTKITLVRFLLFISSHGVNFLMHKILLNCYLFLGITNWLLLPLVLLIVVPINFIMVRNSFKRF